MAFIWHFPFYKCTTVTEIRKTVSNTLRELLSPRDYA